MKTIDKEVQQKNLDGGLQRIIVPFQEFVHTQSFSGILLLVLTIAALIWANSAFSSSYINLWNTEISIGIKDFMFTRPLHFYINDGLMAIFFLLVGLEIKREIIAGELSSVRLAALPITAALGGMIFPALIYTAFNLGTEHIKGWGIPTATDIAFALGIMSILGDRVSTGLKVFLTALAIADDMGAVVIIAIFYTSELALGWLILGLAFFALQILANYFNVFKTAVYLFLGLIMLIAFYNAGIHPTIAGVLTAIAIPASNKIDGETMYNRIQYYLGQFESAFRAQKHPLSNDSELQGIYSIEKTTKNAQTPLKRLEDRLHPWVTYFIMPIFALANAGVVLQSNFLSSYSDTVTLGVMAGLIIGKPIGITLFSYLSVKFGIAQLPEKENWRSIFSAGCLAGIGFTMSIFITGLAFTDSGAIDLSKIGILSASLLSGIIGYLLLRSGFTTSGKAGISVSEN